MEATDPLIQKIKNLRQEMIDTQRRRKELIEIRKMSNQQAAYEPILKSYEEQEEQYKQQIRGILNGQY